NNKISGPVHAALTSAKDFPPMVGVDDSTHYRANVQAYKQSTSLSKEYTAKIDLLQKDIEKRKSQILNTSLLSFDNNVQDHLRGKINLGNYIQFLTRHTASTPPMTQIFLKAYQLESSLDFNQVEKERAEIIRRIVKSLSKERVSELYRQTLDYRAGGVRHTDYYRYLRDLCKTSGIVLSRFPEMDSYIQYVLLSDSIHAETLFENIRQMEKESYRRLVRNSEERDLIARSRQVTLLQKLVKFSLSVEEWEEYVSFKKNYGDTVLNSRGIKYGVPIIPQISYFEEFYQEARARDVRMGENLLQEIANRNSDVTVLVTGGFHSQGIEEKLIQSGFTVVSFTPKITQIEQGKETAYLSIFSQEKTPLEKLFSAEKLTLTPEIWRPEIPNGLLAEKAVVYAEARDPNQDLTPSEEDSIYQSLADPNFAKNHTVRAEDVRGTSPLLRSAKARTHRANDVTVEEKMTLDESGEILDVQSEWTHRWIMDSAPFNETRQFGIWYLSGTLLSGGLLLLFGNNCSLPT
ncbi:MAG: hypothetical protein HYY63_04395, partial [Elusimicrobia bacterium]|nr:hypothetical protein [Elusimicrobiota bacterium]